MFRTSKFLISRPMYAVDMGALKVSTDGYARIPAVWFRRKSGVTAACTGELRDTVQRPFPASAAAFLAAYEDSRYGGWCRARWDGRSLWIAPPQQPGDEEKYLTLLKPVLDNYPEIPAGRDDWWHF